MTAPGSPLKTPRQRVRVESRWPAVVAVLLFVTLNTGVRIWLPGEQLIAVPWLAPVIELGLLGVLIAHDPLGSNRRAEWLRRVSTTLVMLLVAAALWATVILIGHLITGSPHTSSPGYLLAYGALILVGNDIAFALLYWHFDAGGPAARRDRTTDFPDFAFTQQLNPELAPPGWFPVFYDYLYLGFTNSTAFSPTDVMPLTTRAKFAMAVQSTASLAVLGLVIAQAVNVLQ